MQLQTAAPGTPNQSDLEEFIREADEVKSLTSSRGWSILERDFNGYKEDIAIKLAYLNPKKPEYWDAKILFIAIDKLMSIVSDYAENRDKAIELLTKIQNPEIAVTMDVDTE